MNPEQRSTGPLPVQPDPDSSQPDAESGQRKLIESLLGCATVKISGGEEQRRQSTNRIRRFARPVDDRTNLAGGENRWGQNDRVRRFAA